MNYSKNYISVSCQTDLSEVAFMPVNISANENNKKVWSGLILSYLPKIGI